MKKVILFLVLLTGASTQANEVTAQSALDTIQNSDIASYATCISDLFPPRMGSTLTIALDSDGKPSDIGEAQLWLHDTPNNSNVATVGDFYISPPTLDEDGIEVNYYSWGGGMGNDDLNLIPDKMVTYDFNENYQTDRTVLLGIIKSMPNGKVENDYTFHCQAAVSRNQFLALDPNCHPDDDCWCRLHPRACFRGAASSTLAHAMDANSYNPMAADGGKL